MNFFLISIVILGILTYIMYTIVNFKKTIALYQERIDSLSKMVDKQQAETKSLLTAYMTESRVIAFYGDVSPLIKDQEVVELFNRLAKDEEKHISLLEDCLSRKI
ncbi:MAG: hypothetical protein OEV42_11440 [Deltaproteobacteria bacterium]|nr:hypothetical protein [Deltaproteobacteria bacterium]